VRYPWDWLGVFKYWLLGSCGDLVLVDCHGIQFAIGGVHSQVVQELEGLLYPLLLTKVLHAESSNGLRDVYNASREVAGIAHAC